MQHAIRVESVSKRYRIGSAGSTPDTLYEVLSRGLRAPLQRLHGGRVGTARYSEFWALRDVSFEVGRGEAVGIVGPNGAGKSTLLKVLSRITPPTSGRAEIIGRAAGLLEVGTGFHSELTGRENVYLNGAILGMGRREIARKFDEIVAFAEVEPFLDTPVKRYSSGMYVRLAFAVAAHLDAEVLLVDEVLAVGDAGFQAKCLSKMENVTREGRTVVLVSHNLQTVRDLCARAVLLVRGTIQLDGDSEGVAAAYYSTLESEAVTDRWESEAGLGSDVVRLHRLAVRQAGRGREGGVTGGRLGTNEEVVVEMEVALRRVPDFLCIGFDLVRPSGAVVLRSYHTDDSQDHVPLLNPGVNRLHCRLPAELLNGGTFYLSPRIGIHNREWIVHEERMVSFQSVLSHGRSGYWVGVSEKTRPGDLAPILHWSSESGGGGAPVGSNRQGRGRRRPGEGNR